MTVGCAWCQKEGRPGLIRNDDSCDAPFESHGICDWSAPQSAAHIEELRVTSARYMECSPVLR